ncbi:MAG: AsmA family protein [Gammaproteobacteria bacterium]|nr:AsmA family protein [Gammaproteobacteria bacterium]
MKKLLKVIAWLLSSVVLIVLLLVLLIPILVDPNDYKDKISDYVEQKTGRTLTIEGDIDLALSLPLSLSLELGHVELSNTKGFKDKYIARIQHASLHVALMPLLTEKRLDIGEVRLSDLELNLVKNKQGRENWGSLSDDKKTNSDQLNAYEEIKPDTSSNTVIIPALRLAGLNIKDATINWTDEQSGHHLSLSKSNVTISELVENRPFELTFNTHIKSNTEQVEGELSITSSSIISLKEQMFQFSKTQVSLNLTGDKLPSGTNKTLFLGDIHFNGQAQKLEINNIQLTSYDILFKGDIYAEQLDSDPTFKGQIAIDSFSPRELAKTLGNHVPKMQDAQALSTADAQFNFNGDKNSVTFNALNAHLDDTSLNGIFSIKNFKQPFYQFDLSLNELNLDNYAAHDADTETVEAAIANPIEKQASVEPKKQSPKIVDDQKSTLLPIFPIDTLRQLNMSGQLVIAQLTTGNITMSNVTLVLRGNNGLVQIAPLKANLYGGHINLNADIDVRNEIPQLTITNELKNVQIGDLLLATKGNKSFTGAGNIFAKISTQGNDQEQLIQHANGHANIFITDGHIKALDILSTLRQAQALYNGTPAPSDEENKNTQFSELKGTVNIKNGVLSNNDLESISPIMQVTGKGTVDFPKEYIDYTLSVQLLNSLKIDSKTKSSDLTSKKIPYTIKGNFSDIAQKVDMNKVFKKEVKKKIADKINEKLEEKFGDKFKNFLKF